MTKAARLAGSITATVLLVAACGSSTSSSPPAAAHTGSSSPGATATTVETHSGPLGTYLTGAAGKSLYMFASDTPQQSSCTGQCLTFWPPLTTTGAPTASAGASASMLGTITGSDGAKQVTYDGHPLYYFAEDKAAGEITGQGSNGFGAKWWLLAPSGKPITAAVGPTAAPTSSSSGGGY